MNPRKFTSSDNIHNDTMSNSKNNTTTIKSSFPGIVRYTGQRGSFHPNVFEWLEGN